MLRSLIFVLCLFVGYSLARTDKELHMWFIQNGLECNKKYPVTMDEFEILKKLKIPDTKNAKCLQACVFKRINWMNDKGMFDTDAAYKFSLNEYTDPTKLQNAKKLYEICAKVNDEVFNDDDGSCDRGAALAKCLTENSVKLGFTYSK